MSDDQQTPGIPGLPPRGPHAVEHDVPGEAEAVPPEEAMSEEVPTQQQDEESQPPPDPEQIADSLLEVAQFAVTAAIVNYSNNDFGVAEDHFDVCERALKAREQLGFEARVAAHLVEEGRDQQLELDEQAEREGRDLAETEQEEPQAR
jgi:hypothetical protein